MTLFGLAGPWPSHDRHGTPLEGVGTPRGPLQGSYGDLSVALEGEPIWLNADSARAAALDPLEPIIRAYRQQGWRFLEQLHGRFALALVDRAQNTAVLALDRMGIEHLAYALTPGGALAFSSSVEAIARHPGIDAPLRQQALFDYMLMHMVPSPETVYGGVYKLQPGTCALYKNGRVTIERYWRPHFVESRGEPFEVLKSDLQGSLKAAVQSCAPDERTGAFLSGGLDSSSVAGMLGKVRGQAPTFSIGFGVDAYDELQYARIANRHFGTAPHEYHVTPDDIVTAFPKIAAAYDEPFGNSSAVPTYFCARLAIQHGVTHLLAGDGGDEIFGGNERYARQSVFEAYYKLPQALRERIIEPFAQRIDPEHRITPLRKFRSYVDQARIPMPERLESWNLMYRTDLDAMLEPDFRSAIDTRAPLRTMAQVYSAAPSRSLLNTMLFYDWHYTLADNDLRKVGTMCALAGVKVSYPMLDPRMIDVSLRVPPQLKMRRLELRTFYKRAMADFLPEEILRKTKHGFGLPFGVWLKTHRPLSDLIFSYLSDLKARRIVRASFIDMLIEQHRTGHPGYFGYAIWDLAMLEAWLSRHAAACGRSGAQP